MRLPASVLGTLRVGLSATALMAGCDAEAPEQAQPVMQTVSASPAVAEVEPEPSPALGAQVEAKIVEATREAERSRTEMTLASARPEVERDPTAFVPFSEEPSEAAPIRPRIRPRVRPRPVRRPAPKTEPARVRPWGTAPTTKWDGDSCPACGRG